MMYNIWEMDKHGIARRIDQSDKLIDAANVAKCETGYRYIMKWTTKINPIAGTVEHVSRYVWGILDGWAHTNDMRATVRNVLAGAR